MAPEKRNQFLDAEESDDDGSQGYDSEADELQKGGRSAKRRKVESEDEDEDDNMSMQEEDLDSEADTTKPSKNHAKHTEDTEATSGPKEEKKDSSRSLELPGISKPLTKKNLVATEKAVKKSGVVYLSRIPPFMKPQKLRSLLEPYGQINRIFLAPEDPAVYTRRVRSGGNKKKSYTEGWVEFVNKKDAKQACDLLNAQTIGGKKGSYYRDDIWNLLYLKGFKWHNLTEQIAAENAERTSRMRAEISRTTKENKEFVRNVEQAKVLDGIQSKKAAKRKKLNEDGADQGVNGGSAPEKVRTFKQKSLARKQDREKEKEAQPEQVQRVLSKIF